MENLERFFKEKKLGKVVVLTGAGISAESGLATFRETGGLWEKHSIEDVATPEGFARDPELVYKFYNERKENYQECEPNRGHLALVEMEEILGDRFLLVTQNVDHLHEKAGSKNLLHMHGEILKARCMKCSEIYEWPHHLDSSDFCGACSGSLRPHVVWFNEMPLFMEKIQAQLAESSLFIAIGTSGKVYPAAGFSHLAQMSGAFTVELNIEATGGHFSTVIEGPGSTTVDMVLDLLREAAGK